MKRKQSIASVLWDLALRYRLIETIALWEGHELGVEPWATAAWAWPEGKSSSLTRRGRILLSNGFFPCWKSAPPAS